MHNLLSLLMTRPEHELSQISQRWAIALPRASRAQSAAVLGREMVKDSSAHRLWEAFSAPSRQLLLSLPEQPEQRLSELGTGSRAPELKECLRSGVLWAFEGAAREGGVPSLTLPPVPDPWLVVPPEICRLVTRLREDIAQGDIAGRPLDEALQKLGAGELEALADFWGLSAEPGSYTRDELLDSLLSRMSGSSTDRLAAALTEPARKLYAGLLSAGGRAPVLRLAEHTGLSREQLREACSDLAERMLALEMYADGWVLFAPKGLAHATGERRPGRPAAEHAAAPSRRISAPAWAPAWDLINLLRGFELHDVPAGDGSTLPEAFELRYAGTLVTRPAEPAENIRFLYQASRTLGLIATVDGLIKPTRRARGFTAAPLETQSRHLLQYWIEHGSAAEEVALRGAPGYRRDGAVLSAARSVLLEFLAASEPGAWHSAESLIALLQREEPNLLRPHNRLVRDLGSAGAREALQSWLQVEGEWVRRVLAGPLKWLHVAELAGEPADAYALTADGGWLTGRRPPPHPPGKPEVSVTEEGRIQPSAPDSAMLWTLAGFARPARTSAHPVYFVDRRSVARARGAGIPPEEILRFLRAASAAPLPRRLVELIRLWGAEPHRVRAQAAVLLTCETEAGVDELMESPITKPYSPRRLDSNTVLLRVAQDNAAEEMNTLLRRLTRSGLFAAESGR